MAEIEQGFEMPVRVDHGLPRSGDLPFEKMAIGESVFFACPSEMTNKVSSRMHGYAGNKIGTRRIMVRKVDGGVRAWRVK